jgi:hypothetical protein
MWISMARRSAHVKWGDALAPANEPALICREKLVAQPYHYWRGASGARYLHSVYSLRDCPALPKATYIIVRRDNDGTRRPLKIGQTVEDADTLNLARLRHLGAKLGGNEVHIHLLAESSEERDMVEADLSLRQMGKARRVRGLCAANDGAAAVAS